MTDPYANYVPPAPPPYKVGAAVTWAWYMFRKHWKVFVVGMIPMVGAILVYYGFFFAFYFPVIFDTYMTDDEGVAFFKKMLILHVVFFAVMIPMTIIYANILRAALVAADRGTPTYRMLWNTERAGRLIWTSLVLTLGLLVGTLLCIVPGLAFGVFAVFTFAFVVDKDLTTIAAIKASFALVKAQFGLVLLTVLTIFGISYVGSFVPIVGMAATMPLMLLIVAYAYRSLVPATPQQP